MLGFPPRASYSGRMTSRIDHTNCSHEATSKARQVCRDRRREALREAQQMYLDCDLTGTGWDNYYATVEMFAGLIGVALDEAYDIVENGPVVS